MHWYLGTHINQLANFNIELDQSQYCLSIIKKYLDATGCAKNNRQRETTLALDFVPTTDDCSVDEDEAKKLMSEYNIDFASCVRSLIYLEMTCTGTSYNLFWGFSDSPLNDDQDSGCSTGCFIITYMGGIVDHSSNLPDPVALSSAEAEYNEGSPSWQPATYACYYVNFKGIAESSMKANPFTLTAKVP